MIQHAVVVSLLFLLHVCYCHLFICVSYSDCALGFENIFLGSFHSPEYVSKVKALSDGTGGSVGDETDIAKGGYDIAALAAGGAITAVSWVLLFLLVFGRGYTRAVSGLSPYMNLCVSTATPVARSCARHSFSLVAVLLKKPRTRETFLGK